MFEVVISSILLSPIGFIYVILLTPPKRCDGYEKVWGQQDTSRIISITKD